MSDLDLSPDKVSSRFAELRGLCPLELDVNARARLTCERPASPPERFEVAVARRLDELRALCELAQYLHRRP